MINLFIIQHPFDFIKSADDYRVSALIKDFRFIVISAAVFSDNTRQERVSLYVLLDRIIKVLPDFVQLHVIPPISDLYRCSFP